MSPAVLHKSLDNVRSADHTIAKSVPQSIHLAQFLSLIVVLLVAAAVIAFSKGDNFEGFAFLIVIILNANIGDFTEWKAEQAWPALQQQLVELSHVIRDGAERSSGGSHCLDHQGTRTWQPEFCCKVFSPRRMWTAATRHTNLINHPIERNT